MMNEHELLQRIVDKLTVIMILLGVIAGEVLSLSLRSIP